jgi:DNA-binding transcriptional MocR family regulator
MFTDEKAVSWLRERPKQEVEVAISELARQWGWSRQTVMRRLKRWAGQGFLTYKKGSGGLSVIIMCQATEAPSRHAAPGSPDGVSAVASGSSSRVWRLSVRGNRLPTCWRDF